MKPGVTPGFLFKGVFGCPFLFEERVMPYKPQKPCAYPGCPKLTNERYCPEHKKLMEKQYDTYVRSRSSSEFYHSHEWKKKRQNYLVEHPFCVECWKHGKLSKAQMVDHIVPIKMGGAALDDENLQGLCWSCHSRKSIQEGSRYGKRRGE